MIEFVNTKKFQNEISKLSKYDNLVFCDIDGTIYRKSLFLDLLYYFIELGLVSKAKQKKLEEYRKARKNRTSTYDEYIKFGVIEIFEKVMKNKNINRKDLIKISNYIIKNNGDEVLTYTLNKLYQLQSLGYKIIFISGSPIELVGAFANKYNFDIGFGTYSKYDKQGFFNGEFEVLANNKNKHFLINEIINIVSPKNIISFGDTSGDLDMVQNASLGYIINPTKELYEKTKEMDNIITIIERKDLILEITKENRKNINYY